MSQHSALVIGCGSIGERHIRCFLNTKRTKVTACDSNTTLLQKMADAYGVQTTTDWEAALKTDIDVVVICTPAHLHVQMAIKALNAGKHVLIEKPLSQSLQGVDELIATRDRSGKQAAVAYVLHVYPVLVAAREFIRQGSFGPVRQATMISGQSFPFFRPAYAQTYYRDHKTGGGAIQDALTHSVNWVESAIGPADSVLCDCAHQVLADVEVEDTVHAASRHGAALVNFSLNQFQAPNEVTYQFNSAKGSVLIEVHRNRWGTLAQGATEWTWNAIPPIERDFAFTTQASAFLDQVEGQPTRLCTLEAAAATLRFNLAALASAKSGSRVTCSSIHA